MHPLRLPVRVITSLLLTVAVSACESEAASTGVSTDVTSTGDTAAITDTAATDTTTGSDAIAGSDATTPTDATAGGDTSTDPDTTTTADTAAGTDATTGSDSPWAGTIVINEIHAGGSKTATKPDDGDWAELYNTTKTEVDVGGWKFGGIAGGLGGALSIPAGVKIAGGGFQLVYFNHLGLGTPRVDKRLSSNGALAAWDANGLLVDSIQWLEGASPSGSSWDRVPDGAATWKTVTPPTPGQPNAK